MLTFNEDTHEYFYNNKKLISVTQLMKKHGLSPDYGNVPTEILKAKAERGTIIHKEIELYNKSKEIGFTHELINFIVKKEALGFEVLESEVMVNNDVVAGTIDLIINDNNEYIVADIKTTSTLHKDAVSWQLSLYAYLFNRLQDKIKVTKGQAFHFDKDGNLKIIDIPLKPIEEIEKLLNCERIGTVYKQELARSEDTDLVELIQIEKVIKYYDDLKKAAEEKAQAMRAALMESMEKNNVKTFENDAIKITYVDTTTRTTIDSAKLKKELPEIAAKYQKTSNVKASLRITLKENKNE